MGCDALYARYSSSRQDDGTSIDIQIDACRRAASGPCSEYFDRAKTGRAVAGRSEFRRLLDDAEAGKVTRVLVYKFDRLGRNLAEAASVVADLEDMGIEVISATEGKDALARGIHLAVAEHYSRALAERTLDGLKKRFEQGAWTGGVPPYGFRVAEEDGTKRLAANADEAEVVRRVFSMYLNDKMSLKDIAERLNGDGIKPRRAPAWEHTSVRGILVNRFVTGDVLCNRRQCRLDRHSGRRRHHRKTSDAHMVRHDESLRIIAEEDFVSAQERLASRGLSFRGGRPARSRSQMRAFTGLPYCASCGNVCYAERSHNAKGDYHYYRCGLRQRRGAGGCPNAAGVREDALMSRVQDVLSEVLADDALADEAVAEAEKVLAGNRESAAGFHRQIADFDEQVRRITALAGNPATDPRALPAFTRQIGELEAGRAQALAGLERLRLEAETSLERLTGCVRKALEELREGVASVATGQEFHDLVEEVLGPIEVHEDGSLTRKAAPEATPEADLPYLVAGAGFEPATSGL